MDETRSTIRVCDNCKYEAFMLEDSGFERACKHCDGGLMKIIARSKKEKMK